MTSRDSGRVRSDPLDLSVLIPVFNEVDNVEPLHAELDAVLRALALRYELIFVDDGSTDGTAARLEAIQRARSRARPGRVPAAQLRPDGGLVGRARPGTGRDPRAHRRRSPERPGRHPPAPGAARSGLRRRLGLAQGPPRRPGLRGRSPRGSPTA